MSIPDLRLSQMLSAELIVDLDAVTKPVALRRLADRLAEDPRVLDGEALYRAVVRREDQASTGVGMGIAIPHVKIPEVTDYVVAVGRSKAGIDFGSLDNQPVYMIFMIGASDRQTREFVKILANLTHLLKNATIRQSLIEAPSSEAFLEIIRSHE